MLGNAQVAVTATELLADVRREVISVQRTLHVEGWMSSTLVDSLTDKGEGCMEHL